MKKIIILSSILLSTIFVQAQESQLQEEAIGKYAPQEGDISLAVLFGRGNFLTSGLVVPPSPEVDWTVPGTAPYADFISANHNSASNIVGVEARYFLSESIALKFSGGAVVRDTPSRMNVPSSTDFDQGNNQTWIPNYESVKEDNQMDANFTMGGEYHFSSRFDRVSPYTGLSLPFYYARRSLHDPTISINDAGEAVITDVGMRHVEILGAGAQLVAGVDFHLLQGLYIGAETKPVSYVYAYSRKSPGSGLEHLKADSHTFSFLAQTFLKIGFKF